MRPQPPSPAASHRLPPLQAAAARTPRTPHPTPRTPSDNIIPVLFWEYLLFNSAADSSAFLVTSFYASPRSPAPFATAMASGFGVLTPKGRCYPFWLVSPSPLSLRFAAFPSPAVVQDFTKCMQDDSTKQPSQCKLLAEDYVECLHHHKQVGLLWAARTTFLA